MSNRIRYGKTDHPGILRSTKMFYHPTNGGRFYIILDVNNLQFRVYDDAADACLLQGDCTSLHKLKITAKNALVSLGVDGFEKESRVKRVEEEAV